MEEQDEQPPVVTPTSVSPHTTTTVTDDDDDDHTASVPAKPSRHVERARRKAVALARRAARLAAAPHRGFVGRHKWLGGAVDHATGIIYGVPSHSVDVVCVHPPALGSGDGRTTLSTIPLPNAVKEGRFKWLRGIVTHGHLYGIPAWSNHGVLKVRLAQKKSRGGGGARVTVLPLPVGVTTTEVQDDVTTDRDRWMWHGAGLSDDTSSSSSPAIYCVPSNAARVLKVNILTDELTEIGPVLRGQNKWYGGIRGRDGCIYGMPYTATGVLRIDPKTDTVEVLGDFPAGGWKWHGGLLAPANGCIYAFPAHADTVLRVDTNNHNVRTDDDDRQQRHAWRVSTLPIHRHPQDNDAAELRYKWLGGAHGADGCVYGMPSDATSLLKIDPATDRCTTFGRVGLRTSHASSTPILNKWQGGVLCPTDGCVYAVPADADCVLKINTNPNDGDAYNAVSLLPLPTTATGDNDDDSGTAVEDKWQGGFLGRDGLIYGIPENIDRVMQLTPGDEAKVEFLT